MKVYKVLNNQKEVYSTTELGDAISRFYSELGKVETAFDINSIEEMFYQKQKFSYRIDNISLVLDRG